jgi:FAD:protein FMN transferase
VRPLLILQLLAALLQVSLPAGTGVWVEREAYLMGTSLQVGAEAPSRAAGIQAIEQAFQAVREADSLLSTWREDSELARVNHAGTGVAVTLSAELSAALLEAARWCRATGGAFDPGVGALVDVWELRGAGRVPTPAALARARDATGIHHFVFSHAGRRITRTHSSAWIDSGGFGKGVALRNALAALRRAGVARARLNFGGQVLVLGPDSDGNDWVIPVAHPVHRSLPVSWIRLQDASISTSSQSERFVTAAGRRVGHVIDPRSGQPVSPWGSVSVIAKDPAVADALSTALLVMGPNEGLEWARRHDDIGVLFLVEHNGRLQRRWNEGLMKFLVPESTHQRRT